MKGHADLEDDDDRGPVAFQRYTLFTQPDGRIEGRVHTNDDEDLGIPTTEATWQVKYRDREHMEQAAGRSRVGISGVQVEVFLDGKRI